eukprot:208637-Chlamydomonas_euryale.AAC.1
MRADGTAGAPSSGNTPLKTSARTMALGSSSSSVAMRSPGASETPSGARNVMTPAAGASSGIICRAADG